MSTPQVGGVSLEVEEFTLRPYSCRSSADSYANQRIGLIPYRYRSSADSYADERVGVTTV